MRALALVTLVLAVAVGAAYAAEASPNPKSCFDQGDRLTKLTLIEQLTYNPHLLVLGSSRSRVAMPKVVQSLTGRTTFNAGVRGGSSADEYVFTRLLANHFPSRTRAYLIFVDVGIAGDGVNPELADEPLARPYLGKDATHQQSTCHVTDTYTADGGIRRSGENAAARARGRAKSVPAALSNITAAKEHRTRIDPANTKYFQRLLGFVNAHGATPVVVLNPIYPSVLAKLRHYGFPKRRAAAVYLRWLHKRYRFRVVDGEDIRKWGGRTSDFINVDHIDRANMRRLLRYVIAHTGRILRSR
jgi:hypothetical protein